MRVTGKETLMVEATDRNRAAGYGGYPAAIRSDRRAFRKWSGLVLLILGASLIFPALTTQTNAQIQAGQKRLRLPFGSGGDGGAKGPDGLFATISASSNGSKRNPPITLRSKQLRTLKKLPRPFGRRCKRRASTILTAGFRMSCASGRRTLPLPVSWAKRGTSPESST